MFRWIAGHRCIALVLASVLVLCLPGERVQAIEAPGGWQKQPQDGFAVFSPKDLDTGYFTVMVFDPMPLAGASLEAWAERLAEALSSSYGQIAQRGKPELRPPLWMQRHDLLAQGRSLMATYHAFAVGTDQARMALMLGEPGLFPRYVDTGGELIAQALLESRTGAVASSSDPAPPATATSRAGRSQAPASEQGRLPFPPEAIVLVLNHSTTHYEIWGLEVKETSQVLLGDGRLYVNGKPGGRWRKSGSGYQYDDGNGWKTLPGEPVQRVEGSDLPGYFKADRAAAFGSTSVVSYNRIRFHADGRYEIERYRTGHSQTGAGHDNPSIAAGGAGGSFSSGGATTTSSHFAAGKDERGRYRMIAPYVLELRSDDGSVRQRLAYYSGDGRKWLNLDETSYQRQ